MAPPKFDDLGKAGNDLFKKGFEHGNVKLELKNSANNIDFTVKGCNNLSANAISASLESNIKNAVAGFDVKKTMHTSGKTDLEFSRSDLLKNAGKTTVTGSLSDSGFMPGKFKQAFTRPNMNVNFAAGLSSKPLLNLDAVVNVNNFNAGFALGFDVGSSALKSNNVALNFNKDALSATAKSSCKGDVNLVIHNKLSSTNSIAAMVDYNKSVNLALAGKMTGCAHGSTQYKIDNKGILSTSFVTKLDSGCEMTFSANLDTLNLQGGGHKVGALFKFNL